MDRSYSHSRARAKSASVLPPHPELDITRRRSGIRHFSHVPSVKYSKRPKNRSVTSPMRWKNWILGGVAEMYFPKRRVDEGKKKMGVIGNVNDPRLVMAGVPPLPGGGMGCVLSPVKQQRRGPMYPYPLHIPRAAAAPIQQQQQPCQQTVYVQQPASAANPGTATPLDRIMSVASGIGCTIALLFVWIFRYEVLKFGVLFGVLGMLWMAGRWYGQINVLQREQQLVREGRLYTGQVQQQPSQPQRRQPHQQPQAQLLWQIQQPQPQPQLNQQQGEFQQQARPHAHHQVRQREEQQRPQGAYLQQQPQQRYIIARDPIPGRPIPGGT